MLFGDSNILLAKVPNLVGKIPGCNGYRLILKGRHRSLLAMEIDEY
jgi:hypothetical protein